MSENGEHGHIVNQPLGLSVWLWWTLTTTVAGIASWIVITVAVPFTLGFALLGAGTVTGLCVGWAQKKILQQQIPDQDWSRWVRFSTLGATLGWIIVMLLVALVIVLDRLLFNQTLRINPITPLIISSVAGAVFGWTQGQCLQYRQGKVQWVLANAAGWGLGAIIGLKIAEAVVPYQDGILISYSDATSAFIMGSVASVVLGAITGFVVLKMSTRLQTASSSA